MNLCISVTCMRAQTDCQSHEWNGARVGSYEEQKDE